MKNYKGAGVALFRKSENDYEVLLGKRTFNPDKNKWSIPGGGYEERDADLKTTAERELYEETGLKLSEIVREQTPVIYKIVLPFFCWETYMYDVGDWTLRNTRVREFSELKFIPIADLKNYKLAFGVKKEVEIFLKTRRNK